MDVDTNTAPGIGQDGHPAEGTTLTALDHFTVEGGMQDIDRLRAFYRDILGMHDGPRPAFSFPGYWMYAAGRPVVHIVGHADKAAVPVAPTAAFGHIAVRCTGFAAMRAHLERHAIPHRSNIVPGQKLAQLFLHDPMGVMIELLFSDEDVTL
jgi:catechol 2,3-dioxygenase-like lactoylglutathione lyase family enzyme